jgi:hypothetical protein
MPRLRSLFPFAALAAVLVYAAPAPAQTIIDEWQGIKAPPAPELIAATVDPKTTALLMLDFLNKNCAPNPRCVASLPNVQKLLAAARDNGLAVIYSNFPGGDVMPEVARKDTEPLITAFLNRFMATSMATRILAWTKSSRTGALRP